MSAPQPEPVGSVHEETARLFAALEGAAAAWSRGDGAPRGSQHGPPTPGADGQLPTTCGACPLCLALDRLGHSRPDVLDHLTDAVQALGAALAAVTRPPTTAPDDPADQAGSAGRPQPRTEQIEVTD